MIIWGRGHDMTYLLCCSASNSRGVGGEFEIELKATRYIKYTCSSQSRDMHVSHLPCLVSSLLHQALNLFLARRGSDVGNRKLYKIVRYTSGALRVVTPLMASSIVCICTSRCSKSLSNRSMICVTLREKRRWNGCNTPLPIFYS